MDCIEIQGNLTLYLSYDRYILPFLNSLSTWPILAAMLDNYTRLCAEEQCAL